MAQRKILLLASILLCVSVGMSPATAQKKYDPGASDTEIKIGNIMPYSGPLSAYALIGRTQAAFFKKLNDEGGINGRKINFISYDDAFSPPKKDDPAIKEWAAFMDKYFPEGDKTSTFSVYGYATAQTMVQVLKQCGDELTRENIMKQAANLKDFELGLLLPGIKINTGPTDYFPIEQMQMSRFNGEHGELFGSPISAEMATQ